MKTSLFTLCALLLLPRAFAEGIGGIYPLTQEEKRDKRRGPKKKGKKK